MVFLLAFGFSSGLPLYLTDVTLQTWLAFEGVPRETIGLLALVGWPYALKFLWAPLLDRFTIPFLGRRRGWMALTQTLLLASIAAMAWARPAEGVALLAGLAVFVAFLSATQDIAVDAYRTDVLEPREMGAGAGIFVTGYRIALAWTGGAAVIMAGYVPWSRVYLIMAGCMLVGIVASVGAPEPRDAGQPPATLRDAVLRPASEFFSRLGARRALMVLAFVAIYKLGDNVVSVMTAPFLVQIGFSAQSIGAVRGFMGLIATVVGVLAGGAYISQIGIVRALWVFGLLQAATNLSYFALAEVGPSQSLMVLTINLEYFAQGLGTAGLVAFLMSLCNRRFSATQFALLSSVMALNRIVGSVPSGFIATAAGWPLFFLISVLMAVPGLALAWRMRNWDWVRAVGGEA